MKKYIDAELQIVHVNNNDIVTASSLNFIDGTATEVGSADRFRDFEDYSY